MTTADTEVTPMDLGSYASRVTFIAGNAVKRAATDAKEQLLEAAGRSSGGGSGGYRVRQRIREGRGGPRRQGDHGRGGFSTISNRCPGCPLWEGGRITRRPTG